MNAVGPAGTAAGIDVNPGMLATARKHVPSGNSIDWYEASAESMPLPDRSFDVVLCQMGLQFMPNKPAAVTEMHRVLTPGGRALVTVPGPEPDLFSVMRDALGRRIAPEAAAFVKAATARLDVPGPRDFLWQYINSTPMAGTVMKADEATRAAFEREVTDKWQPFRADGRMSFEVRITTALGWA
jgi:ubiquinone/menaquinone biosynthesis C-methylase UbiE